MIVMIVYVLLVAAGEVLAFGVSLMLDNFIPAGWSMIVAMGLFFGVIWAMWPLAVYVTEKWLVGAGSAKAEPAKAR